MIKYNCYRNDLGVVIWLCFCWPCNSCCCIWCRCDPGPQQPTIVEREAMPVEGLPTNFSLQSQQHVVVTSYPTAVTTEISAYEARQKDLGK